MDLSGENCWVPEHARAYLRGLGYRLLIEDMEGRMLGWGRWMRAVGDFCDYHDGDGFGQMYEVHRRSIMPAIRVCREWSSLLLNEKTQVVCEDQGATDWLEDFFTKTGFWGRAQETVIRSFGLGTGAFGVFLDMDMKAVKVRHYDARMVVPLTWDAERVTECAFCTRACSEGKPIDQLQIHL